MNDLEAMVASEGPKNFRTVRNNVFFAGISCKNLLKTAHNSVLAQRMRITELTLATLQTSPRVLMQLIGINEFPEITNALLLRRKRRNPRKVNIHNTLHCSDVSCVRVNPEKNMSMWQSTLLIFNPPSKSLDLASNSPRVDNFHQSEPFRATKSSQ
jgi:hypothetical protein